MKSQSEFVEEKYYMNTDVIGEKDGFVIRLAKADDVVNYYEQNYCPLDKEVARLTGCKEEFSKEEHLVFICGHYEGYDERIRTLVTDEVSLGDYVLTGGELGAMVMIDATVRLLPDVLGNQTSAQTDSYSTGLLEHPQYTRPAEYNGMKVPEVLTNGNHKLIEEWQLKESLRRTYQRRPDLLEQIELTPQMVKFLEAIKKEEMEQTK